MASQKGNVLIPLLIGVFAVAILAAGIGLGLFLNSSKNQSDKVDIQISPTKAAPKVYASPTRSQQPAGISPVTTPSAIQLRSDLCPVLFTVPGAKMFINSKGEYGHWQIKDTKDQRFMFLPRAEEVNGRRTTGEMRADGQIYYNPQASVEVYCQDNANKWSNQDFMTYVLKADFLKSTNVSKIKLWGRDVYELIYTMTGYDVPQTTWLFATPGVLYRVEKRIEDTQFKEQTEEVFNNLTFL